MFPSYTDRHGIGGILAILAIGAVFVGIALAPYVAAIVAAAHTIGGAR